MIRQGYHDIIEGVCGILKQGDIVCRRFTICYTQWGKGLCFGIEFGSFLFPIMREAELALREERYKDRRTVSFQGFSTIRVVFSCKSPDMVFPMTVKFVERVVIPHETTSFIGVSLVAAERM